MKSLTPERRRAATLAAWCAAITPSAILLTRDSASASRVYGVMGMIAGVLVGGAIRVWRKRQGAC